MTSVLLQAKRLTKDFGARKGVFNLDIKVTRGEIVGFVGPNGAGKSTTINLITGFTRPTGGSFSLLGEPVTAATIYRLMPRLGVLFSEQAIDNELTPTHIFNDAAALLGKDCSKQWRRMSELLDLDVTQLVSRLSLGNKKKVGVILALMHEPELVIMDEPTSGLDPLIRQRFALLLAERTAAGAGVFLSSHDLTEVQEICDRVIMLKAGHVVASETTNALLDRAERLFRLVNPPKRLREALAAGGYIVVDETNGEATIRVKTPAPLLNALHDAHFSNFYIERPSLETAFKDMYA